VAEKVDELRVNRLLASLAARQHAVVTRSQLVALGFGDDAIASRVRAGWLVRVHRGVLAVGRQPLTLHGRFLAAVFSAGERAVLSHLSAAVLWNLLPQRGPRIDVTVPGGARKVGRVVIVHRSPLADQDVATRRGVPITSPTRTLLDLAAVVSRRELERALDEAAYLRLDVRGLRSRRGRRGGALLTRVLAEHRAGTTLTRSEMEERMLALCRRCRLPSPLVNTRIEGDRRRDASLTVVGWRVMRITWKRLLDEPQTVAAQLKRLLDA
jgi:predicted transcriptional regulator of viral defense system